MDIGIGYFRRVSGGTFFFFGFFDADLLRYVAFQTGFTLGCFFDLHCNPGAFVHFRLERSYPAKIAEPIRRMVAPSSTAVS